MPPTPAAARDFGRSIDTDGKYLVVGSPLTTYNLGLANSIQATGSINVYERSGQNWINHIELFATSKGVNDRFGYSVAIDKDIIAVGAYWQAENATGGVRIIGSGSVHIFRKDSADNWFEAQIVQPSTRYVNEEFGRSVDLSNGQLIVGAIGTDISPDGQDTVINAGAAYLFELDSASNTFVQKQVLNPSIRREYAHFGSSVAIERGHIVVGAPSESIPSVNLQYAGAAYIFSENRLGQYVEVQRVFDTNPNNGEFLGESVDLFGKFMVIGHSREAHDSLGQNPLTGAGAAHVFERNPDGTWAKVQKLTPADRQNGDTYGSSVAISDNFILVGAVYEDHDASGNNPITNSGSAYLYRRNNGGRWSLIQKFDAENNRQTSALFSTAVGLYDSTAVVGAANEDINGEPSAGAVYAFSKCSSLSFDTVVACQGFTWIDGNTYFEDNPQATVILQSSTGCDSVVRLVFHQISDTGVVVSNPMLTAIDSSATSYQWLECDGWAVIPGANQISFIPAKNGSYALAITKNGCTDTSACFDIHSVSLLEENPESFLYPNPSSGILRIPEHIGIQAIRIFDLSGKAVVDLPSFEGATVGIGHLPDGVYVVQMKARDGSLLREQVILSKE
ncbi:MAG: T9SS type A sorting domain-containing protein [Flavobacteriia bacterium]|nr:T9SS type A sorting domain-containing protein [Flavobacteriia bacterium]